MPTHIYGKVAPTARLTGVIIILIAHDGIEAGRIGSPLPRIIPSLVLQGRVAISVHEGSLLNFARQNLPLTFTDPARRNILRHEAPFSLPDAAKESASPVVPPELRLQSALRRKVVTESACVHKPVGRTGSPPADR